MEKQKNYEELTISDYFMFGKICSKPENRKLILDALLQIDFQEKEATIEKHIQAFKDTKYVRLDLLTEDETGTIYDAEMQNEPTNNNAKKELPQRSRYYQSILDTGFFDSGKDYIYLPETYIIFICTYDPFGKGIPVYTFETKCLETDIPTYNEKSHKIIFNTTANLENLPTSLKNMLEYINTSVTTDRATEMLDIEVKKARLREEWKAEYMLTLVHDTDVFRDGFEEGAESRQPEIDALNHTVAEQTAEQKRLTALLISHGIDPNENKTNV